MHKMLEIRFLELKKKLLERADSENVSTDGCLICRARLGMLLLLRLVFNCSPLVIFTEGLVNAFGTVCCLPRGLGDILRKAGVLDGGSP